MANSLESFYNSMAGAFHEANKVLKPQATFLTGKGGMPTVYTDIQSQPMAQYKKVTLQVPNSVGDAVDAITTKPTPSSLKADPTEITLDFMPAWGFELTSLEELTAASSDQLRSAYVDEAITKIVRAANNYIASAFTVANYSLSGNISGAAGKGVQLSEFTDLFGALAARDVPVYDNGKLYFAAHSSIYTGLMKDSEWRDAAKVGDSRAQNQIGTGVLPITYGAMPMMENQMPSISPGSHTSAYYHERAYALVTAPLPAPEASVAHMYNVFGPLNILMTISYTADQPKHTLWFHALMGGKPWRKDHAALHVSTKAAIASGPADGGAI
jgi:hypothetical protein